MIWIEDSVLFRLSEQEIWIITDQDLYILEKLMQEQQQRLFAIQINTRSKKH
jgi:hypothetical protein